LDITNPSELVALICRMCSPFDRLGILSDQETRVLGIIPGITDTFPPSTVHVRDEICRLSVAVPETETVGVMIIELSDRDTARCGMSLEEIVAETKCV